VVVVKTLFVEVAEMGGFEAERIDIGFLEPVAEHFWESFLISDFNDGDAAGFQDAVKFIRDFLHVVKVVGGANHHESIEGIVGEGKGINIARLGVDFVAVEVVGLGELGLGVVKEGGNLRAVEILVGEATVAAGDIDKSIHLLRKKAANREAVGHVFIFAVGVFPENLFVIVAVVISDNFFRRLGVLRDGFQVVFGWVRSFVRHNLYYYSI